MISPITPRYMLFDITLSKEKIKYFSENKNIALEKFHSFRSKLVWNGIEKGTCKIIPKSNRIKIWQFHFCEHAVQFPWWGHSRQTGWQPIPASLLVTWNKEDAERQLNSWSPTVTVTELICSLLHIFTPEKNGKFLVILIWHSWRITETLSYYLLFCAVFVGVTPHQNKQKILLVNGAMLFLISNYIQDTQHGFTNRKVLPDQLSDLLWPVDKRRATDRTYLDFCKIPSCSFSLNWREMDLFSGKKLTVWLHSE